MGDTIQKQLDRLLSLFFEERAANRAHREEMNSKIAALRQGGLGHAEGHSSRFPRNNGRNDETGGSGVVPCFAKLELPKSFIGNSRIDAVDQALQTRDVTVGTIRNNLLQDQQHMRTAYARRRRDLEFHTEDRVLLRLQPCWQLSLSHRRNQKLSARFYVPFTIKKRIEQVAYALDLPPSSKIHHVFHVSLLKPYHTGTTIVPSSLPPVSLEPLLHRPLAVLDTRIQAGHQEVLVQWEHTSPADDTWELLPHIRAKFPTFALEDKCDSDRGSDVT